MKDVFVELVRELRGTVRSRRQEKIREVELGWSGGELAGFRAFVAGLHASEMADVCYALSDAQSMPLLEILGDFAEKDPELMKAAFASMEKAPLQGRLRLARRLLASPRAEVRARTCKMLGNSGPEAASLLGQALGDGESRVRLAAIEAIARGGFKKLGQKLFPLLRSQDPELRSAALRAVTSLGLTSPALSGDLLAILKDSSQEEEARSLAAGILARGGNREARALLLDALADGRKERVLRLAAAKSLSGYEDVEALGGVLRAVDDADAEVAKTARLALSQKHSQAFAGNLGRLLEDPDEGVAVLAAELLGGLNVSAVTDILLGRLKAESRPAVVNAVAQAMSQSGIPGAWDALMQKQRSGHIESAAFYSALADVAEEGDIARFAALFDTVEDAEAKRVIMERLALFARTSPVAPESAALARRVLSGEDKALHLSAAMILAHAPDLDPATAKAILQRLAAHGDEPAAVRVVGALLRNRGEDLADIFLAAPPQAAPLLAKAAREAPFLGAKPEPLFRTVAAWARQGAPYAREALHAMAVLAPSALVDAMAKCPDRIFLLEAWAGLPPQERALRQPDLPAFFAEADKEDALAAIRLLDELKDPRCLRDVADVAFTAREAEVRKAALALTRQIILAGGAAS